MNEDGKAPNKGSTDYFWPKFNSRHKRIRNSFQNMTLCDLQSFLLQVLQDQASPERRETNIYIWCNFSSFYFLLEHFFVDIFFIWEFFWRLFLQEYIFSWAKSILQDFFHGKRFVTFVFSFRRISLFRASRIFSLRVWTIQLLSSKFIFAKW